MKKILLLIASLVLIPCHMDAQFKFLDKALNKVNKALENVDKAMTKVDNSLNNILGIGYGAQIGSTVAVGNASVSTYGTDIGLGISYTYCERWPDGNVHVGFQLTNANSVNVESLLLRTVGSTENDSKVVVYQKDSTLAKISALSINGVSNEKTLTASVAANSSIYGEITLTGVPSSLQTLNQVVIGVSAKVSSAATYSNLNNSY